MLADSKAVESIIVEMKQKKLNEDDIEELAALKKLTSVLTESHIEQLTEVKTWLHYNQKLYESYLNRHNPIGPSENYDHNLSELANTIKPDKLRYKTHKNLDILPDPNRTQYLNDCKTVIAEKIKADLTYIDSLISEFLIEKSKAKSSHTEPQIYVKQEETSDNNIVSKGLDVLRAFIAGPPDLPPTEEDSPSENAPKVDVKSSVINYEHKEPDMLFTDTLGNETNKPVQKKADSNKRKTCHHPPAAKEPARPFRDTKHYSEKQINKDLKQAKINSDRNKSIPVPDPRSNRINHSNQVSRTPTQSIIGMHHSDQVSRARTPSSTIGGQHQQVAQLLGKQAREDGVNPPSKPVRYI